MRIKTVTALWVAAVLLIVQSSAPVLNAADEPARRWMIGLQCVAADKLIRGHLKLGETGLVVQDVIDGSPAATAGLQEDDILLQVSDKKLTATGDLMQQVQASRGEPLEINILRAGDPMKVTVVPQELASIGLHQDGSRLRQFHPGIIIDRSSNPEDAHLILEQALKAAGIDASTSLPADVADGNSPWQRQQEQLEELSLKLQQLTERIAALERIDTSAGTEATTADGAAEDATSSVPPENVQ
jgi:membrane-associated protease RseP (regulator of RpoE activity)